MRRVCVSSCIPRAVCVYVCAVLLKRVCIWACACADTYLRSENKNWYREAKKLLLEGHNLRHMFSTVACLSHLSEPSCTCNLHLLRRTCAPYVIDFAC